MKCMDSKRNITQTGVEHEYEQKQENASNGRQYYNENNNADTNTSPWLIVTGYFGLNGLGGHFRTHTLTATR